MDENEETFPCSSLVRVGSGFAAHHLSDLYTSPEEETLSVISGSSADRSTSISSSAFNVDAQTLQLYTLFIEIKTNENIFTDRRANLTRIFS